MNKKAQWNIGIGTTFIIIGLYLLTRGSLETLILSAIVIGIGMWLIFLEKKEK